MGLQCHACLEDGDFTIILLFIVYRFSAGNTDDIVYKAFAGLFHRFVFYDDSGIEVNPSGLFLARVELVEIFMVGTNVPNGVPRPVVKSTM